VKSDVFILLRSCALEDRRPLGILGVHGEGKKGQGEVGVEPVGKGRTCRVGCGPQVALVCHTVDKLPPEDRREDEWQAGELHRELDSRL
jgi:hypothetical protein